MKFIILLFAIWRDFLAMSRFVLANERGSITVTEAFVNQYHDMLKLQLQQTGSKLLNLIDPIYVHRGVKGQLDDHDRLGAVEAVDIVDRHGDTQLLNPDHSRRWARLVPSEGAVLIDRADKVRMLIDPQNGYRTTVVGALGRRTDRHIINALGGSAITGVDATGTQALPSAQKIAIDTSPNNVLTLAKIKSAAGLLDKFGVPVGAENRIFAYAAGQTSAILAITQAASSDFTRHKTYDRGSMDGIDWMGFLWVLIPDSFDQASAVLNRQLPLSGTTRSCYAFSRSAVGVSIGEDIATFFNERPDKRNSMQVRSEMDMGAVRVWDNAVVEVAALEQ